MTRIIFLDIDGVMINTGQMLVNPDASWERKFDPIPIAIINLLCDRSGAFIVFNTTHNRPFDDVPNIDVALVQQGLKQHHIFDSDPHTLYPSIRRDDAVQEWLKRHEKEKIDWVAFDDVKFTQDERLILIDSRSGLTTQHMDEALIHWGLDCPIFAM